MRMFDVQGIEILAPARTVFDFVKVPANLPRWAHAFVSADAHHAVLRTPAGSVEAGLTVAADEDAGVVDWQLRFADGGIAVAQSRVTPTTRDSSIYSFVLHAPPVALEQIEGALDAQSVTLRAELAQLKAILEG